MNNEALIRRIQEWKNGDENAIEEILKAVEPLLLWCFHRFCKARNETLIASYGDDLLQEGRLAMLSAARHFDPNRKVQFKTFATQRIWSAMRHFVRDQTRLISIPNHVQGRGEIPVRVHGWPNSECADEGEGEDEIRDERPLATEAVDTAFAVEDAFLKARQAARECRLPRKGQLQMVQLEVVRAAIWDELSMREVAQRMELHENKVGYSYKAGLQQLAGFLHFS